MPIALVRADPEALEVRWIVGNLMDVVLPKPNTVERNDLASEVNVNYLDLSSKLGVFHIILGIVPKMLALVVGEAELYQLTSLSTRVPETSLTSPFLKLLLMSSFFFLIFLFLLFILFLLLFGEVGFEFSSVSALEKALTLRLNEEVGVVRRQVFESTPCFPIWLTVAVSATDIVPAFHGFLVNASDELVESMGLLWEIHFHRWQFYVGTNLLVDHDRCINSSHGPASLERGEVDGSDVRRDHFDSLDTAFQAHFMELSLGFLAAFAKAHDGEARASRLLPKL